MNVETTTATTSARKGNFLPMGVYHQIETNFLPMDIGSISKEELEQEIIEQLARDKKAGGGIAMMLGE